MKRSLLIMILVVVGFFGFLIGYMVSSSTGIQPGYFEAAEAGGYGGGDEVGAGLGEEIKDYYKDLYKEE